MTTDLLGLYLKWNLVLMVALLVWKGIGRLAHHGRFELTHNQQLRTARWLFAAVLLVLPLSIFQWFLEVPGPAGAGYWFAGELRVGALIDKGLTTPIPGSGLPNIASAALALLCFGFVVQLFRLLLKVVRLRQVIARAIEWKARGGVQILVSPDRCTPFSTKALGRAQVVLPHTLMDTPEYLRMALTHELQHLRNGDLEWILLIELVKLLCFWNPAVHLWHDEFDCLQEYACDEALMAGPRMSARNYGHCLLDIASMNDVAHFPAVSNMVPRFALWFRHDARLKRRILMLTAPKSARHMTSRVAAHAALAFAGLTLSVLGVFAAEEERRPMPTRPSLTEYKVTPVAWTPASYPQRALAQDLEGWVQLTMTVDETGAVTDPEVIDGCVARRVGPCIEGENVFDASALEAVRAFRFEPRLEDGAMVATSGVQYVFRYELDK